MQPRDARLDLDDILVRFDDDIAPPPPSPHELRTLLDGPAPSSAWAAVPAGIGLPRILVRPPRKLAALTAAAVAMAVIATDGRGPATTTPPLDAAAPFTDAPPAHREQPHPKRKRRRLARPSKRRKPRTHRSHVATRTPVRAAAAARAPEPRPVPAPTQPAAIRPSPEPKPPKGSHFTSEFTP